MLGEQVRREEQKAWEATRLSIKRRGDGTTRGAFTIPDADADTLRAAIEGIIAPRRANLNAAGLGHGRQRLQCATPRPQDGARVHRADRPPAHRSPPQGRRAGDETIAVTIDIDDLRTGSGHGHQHERDDDIGHARATTGLQRPPRRPLPGFRVQGARPPKRGCRLYDRHQRLALAVRDQGCIWPGCDRPPAWCEAHHLNFWSEDGPTDLDNAGVHIPLPPLFLLHEGEWTAPLADDGVGEVVHAARVSPDRVPRRRARFTRQQPRAA